MATGLELRILGPLEVFRDGLPVSVGGVKPRMLLATLALHHGRAVSVDQLIEVLWPADPPKSAMANVQTYISSLRAKLGRVLETRPPGYRLVLSTEALDTLDFCRLAERGRHDEALALWRGDPLEDLPAAPAWRVPVAGLVQQRRTVRQARARSLIDCGRALEALLDLRSLVAEDPLREESWLLFVQALAAAGQRAEALSAYADARRTFAAELGIEPGEPLRRLHRELLGAAPARVDKLDADAAAVVRGLARLGLPSAPAWVASALLGGDNRDDVLERLVQARLLRRTDDGRYSVPALVNLLAPDLPGPDGDIFKPLCGYLFVADAAARALPAQLFGPGVTVAPRWTVPSHDTLVDGFFERERAQLVRCVEFAADMGRSDLAWELAHAMVSWCDMGGHTVEWERTHSLALASCRSAADLLGEAVTLRGLGQLHVYQDHYDAALEAFSRSRLLFARLSNDSGEAGALAGVGTVHRIRGELDQAYNCFRQVLASYVEAGDLHGQAFAHGALGQALLARGELDEAARAVGNGLVLAAQVNDQHRLAHLTHNLGRVLLRKGSDTLGHAQLLRALELFASLGDAHGEAYCLMDIADLEETDSAVSRLTRALEVLERIGDRRAQAKCARRLGELHRDAGRDSLGGAYLDEARRLQATVTPA
ncbi:BTAD domain-containing putative transcriptional regulator [Allorhizocola rhizosphaerae]|uniref:BTAD domain-containing putative transcriptional regulator n=1 Tax=Allorhizocola rhizosphaerae TaxID=1872709 RepID=UPI000E3C2BD6|nr:BTAD domain-containing putative transcriptional regulator [Allorhizocola rhizosphaerae]